MASSQEVPPKPPDATYVRQRWIPDKVMAWVRDCNTILLEYGRVDGGEAYRMRHTARYKARKLRDLMVDLRMHESWQLREHTWHTPDGWAWCLEYIPPRESRA